MKKVIAVFLICFIFSFMSLPAFAQIFRTDKEDFVFKKVGIPENLKFSSDLILKEDEAGGLVISPIYHDKFLWIETGKIPVGFAWRIPRSMYVALGVIADNTSKAGLNVNCYVRYGIDGQHWSSWIFMTETKTLIPELEIKDALKTYYSELKVPRIVNDEYVDLKEEWRQEKLENFDDDGAYCQWLAKKYPDFFLNKIPLIGYLQFRLEFYGDIRLLVDAVKINSISMRTYWNVISMTTYGFKKPEGKWRFDLKQVKK